MYGTFYKREPKNGEVYYQLITGNAGTITVRLLRGIKGQDTIDLVRSESAADQGEADEIATEIVHELLRDGWIPSTDFKAFGL
jgi:hypothetical protein